MITIDQLLESVDLDFEPRFVTKDLNGMVSIWGQNPEQLKSLWYAEGKNGLYSHLRLFEFDDKDWTECIYEVPRKTAEQRTAEKIEKIPDEINLQTGEYGKVKFDIIPKETFAMACRKINEVIDAVNELKEKVI